MTAPTTDPQRSALRRIARDPLSRRKFLALTGGTGASAAFLAACGDDDDDATQSASTTDEMATSGDPLADFGEGDLGIVNYALTLEYLEAGFYAAVAKSGLFKGDEQALIETIGKQEQEHVDALTATAKDLGGQPAPEPKAEFAARQRQGGRQAGGDGREPGRRRVPRSGRGDREPGHSRRGPVDSLERGSPRGRPERPGR